MQFIKKYLLHAIKNSYFAGNFKHTHFIVIFYCIKVFTV